MSCGCSSGQKRLIYACSGAANTGLLADQVARRLTLMGEGKMACGRKAFERYGLPCAPLVLTDFGVEKGATLIDGGVIERVTDAVLAAHPGSGALGE